MNPRPAVISCSNAAGRPDREVGAAEAGDHAAEDHVAVAGEVHVDADRVGRPRVLADRRGRGARSGCGRARSG